MTSSEREAFLYNFYMYKLDLYRGRCNVSAVDPIFSYMLLLLLEQGDLSKFCLLRAEADRFMAPERTGRRKKPSGLEGVDQLWTAYSAGDIPMARTLSESFTPQHRAVAGSVVSALSRKKEEGPGTSAETCAPSNIKRVIKTATAFFRV